MCVQPEKTKASRVVNLTRSGALGIACGLLKVIEACGKYSSIFFSLSLFLVFFFWLFRAPWQCFLRSLAHSLSSSVRLRFCLSLHCANTSLCLPLCCFFSLQHSRANLRRSPLHLKSNELSVGYIISEVIVPVCACANVYVRAHANPRVCSTGVQCTTRSSRVSIAPFLFLFFFIVYIRRINEIMAYRIRGEPKDWYTCSNGQKQPRVECMHRLYVYRRYVLNPLFLFPFLFLSFSLSLFSCVDCKSIEYFRYIFNKITHTIIIAEHRQIHDTKLKRKFYSFFRYYVTQQSHCNRLDSLASRQPGNRQSICYSLLCLVLPLRAIFLTI